VDGLLFTPCAGMPDEVERLPAMGTPVVVMDREAATTPLNAVTMNNYGSAEKATRLLIASGYRRTPPTATIAAIRWRLEHRLGGFGQPVHSFMTAPFREPHPNQLYEPTAHEAVGWSAARHPAAGCPPPRPRSQASATTTG